MELLHPRVGATWVVRITSGQDRLQIGAVSIQSDHGLRRGVSMAGDEHRGATDDADQPLKTDEVRHQVGLRRIRIGQLDITEHVSGEEYAGVGNLNGHMTTEGDTPAARPCRVGTAHLAQPPLISAP